MSDTRPKISQTAERFSLILAVLMVTGIAILAYNSGEAFRRSSQQEAVTRQVVNDTNALLSALKDAETGQRGYLLTGEDNYLAPYHQALADVTPLLDGLAHLEADRHRPSQAQRVERLRLLVKEKLDELDHTIELRRSQGLDAAMDVVRTDRGRITMDEIRAVCSEIQSTTNGYLTQQTEEARRRGVESAWIAVLGSAAILIFLVLATVSIERGTHRRQQLIDALQASENRIRESRDWLHITLASIGDAVITTDADGKITLLNPVAQKVTGWAGEEASGKPLDEVFVIRNESTGKAVESPVSKVLREGRIVGLANHTELIAKDGRHVPIDDSAAPIRDDHGNIAGVVMVFRDVTERRAVERQLAHVREQLDHEIAGLRTLHQLGPRLLQADGVPSLLEEILTAARAITDADHGTLQLLDPATGSLRIEAQHGFSKGFLDFFNQIHGDEAAVSAAALSNRQQVLVEDVEQSPIFAGTPALEVQRAAGVRAIQSTPIFGRAGDLIGVLSTHYSSPRRFQERDLRILDLLARQAADLIERARAEEQLRVSNTALSRANEDLAQFAFAASHDLQEPLRMITSYSQLLLKGFQGQLDAEAATCIEFITEGTRRMRQLLADLLAYTQVAANNQDAPNRIDLNRVFLIAVENCRAAIDETQALITSDPLPAVWGQEPHFIQLLQNLISNALKYHGGRPPRIHVSADRQNGLSRIAVQDNGMGIAPQYHKQIFGVFKRLHGKSIPGTGIGLAICQRVVERYGGHIWVESRENEGATFYFTLPADQGTGHDK